MLLNFNAATVAPTQAFENLPVGWYTARMVASEEKPTSAGTGSYLQLEFEIVDPAPHVGRKVWDRLNLNNPNEKAVEIAYQTLSAICHAAGVMQLTQSQQLHGIPVQIKVGLSKPQDGYEQRNEIKGYRAVAGTGGAPAMGGQPAQAAPQQWQQPQQQQPMQQQQPVQQAQPQAQWQPQQQAQQQAQQPQQTQQWQPPAQQQPAQQMQQQPVQQVQQEQTQMQQPQVQQQPDWANGQPQQQQQAQQTQQQQVQQGPAPELNVVEQPATNQQAQAAAVAGKAPWQQ